MNANVLVTYMKNSGHLNAQKQTYSSFEKLYQANFWKKIAILDHKNFFDELEEFLHCQKVLFCVKYLQTAMGKNFKLRLFSSATLI